MGRAEEAAGGKAAVSRAVPVAEEEERVPVAVAKVGVAAVLGREAQVGAVVEAAVKDPAEAAAGRAAVVAEAAGQAARAVARAVAVAGDPVVPVAAAADKVGAEEAASPVVVAKVVVGRAGHQVEGIAK